MKSRHSPLSKHNRAKLALKEKLKDPSLSCRAVARLLHDKYRLSLSKTAVHALFKKYNIRETKGRRKELVRYQRLLYQHCGLFFLRVTNELLNLSQSIATLLFQASPETGFSVPELKNLIDYLIYTSYFKGIPQGNTMLPAASCPADMRPQDMRLVYRLSNTAASASMQARLRTFISSIAGKSLPLTSSKEVSDCLVPVAAVKFTAADNTVLYSDAALSQCWETNHIPPLYFANRFSAARRITTALIDQHCIPLMYNASPFGVSSSFVQSIITCAKGIRRIECLDRNNDPVFSFTLDPAQYNTFIMGFNPHTLKKAFTVVSAVRKERTTFPLLQGTFYLYDFESLLIQNAVPEKLSARIILLQKVTAHSSYWGIITNIRRAASPAREIAQKYLSLWSAPYELYTLHLTLLEEYIHPPDTAQPELPLPVPQDIRLPRISSFSDFGMLLRTLQDSCRSILLKKAPPQGDIFSRILSTKGYITEGKKQVIINLIPADRAIKELLYDAVLLANKETVYLGKKRMVMSVVETS